MSSQGAADASQREPQGTAGSATATPQQSKKSLSQATAAEIEELESLFLTKAAEPFLGAWTRLKATIRGAPQVVVNANHLTDLTSAVRKLIEQQKVLPGTSRSPAGSYAATAQAGPQSWTGPPQVREVPTRLPREIVVTSPNATPQDRSRPIKQIVEEINKAKSPEVWGRVLAARRLPSGDIVVTTDTAATKEQLEKDSKWLPAVSSTAQVNRRRFPVMVHGMRTASVDCSKQKEAISQLMGQNRHLRHAIEILHVRWPRKAVKQGKAVTCLIVDVASPEQANTLIDEGLLFQSELKQCELYHGDCRLTQCFNCQKYGHTAKVCRASRKCGLCAAPGHGDHDCGFRQDPSKHRCANCGKGHPAWSQACKERGAQVEKARQAYLARPRRYAEPRSSSAKCSFTPLSSASSLTEARAISLTSTPADRVPSSQGSMSSQQTSSSQALVMRSPEEGWTSVLGKRKNPRSGRDASSGPPQAKKGPGRPRGLSVAARKSQSIAGFLNNEEEL